MRIFAIGSSITSAYWNGAATYYQGIYKALHRLGYQITFAEPDIYGRQRQRETGELDFVQVQIYHSRKEIEQFLRRSSADIVIKHSGVGEDDEWLEALVLEEQSPERNVIFWDVDAPATLARVETDRNDPFRALIQRYNLILTYGGGTVVVDRYSRLGAQQCHAIYNGFDPETHHPVAPKTQFSCDLAFIGNRLPDREKRVEEFFLCAAELAPEMQFLLGGEGWSGKKMPANVRWIGHVKIEDHNAINCSARMVLNVNRESMAEVGFSPPTRVFEAAGAGACLITDQWPGIEAFFSIGDEIVVAASGEQVADILRSFGRAEAEQIGNRMRDRALCDHTYTQRAAKVDDTLQSLCVAQDLNLAS